MIPTDHEHYKPQKRGNMELIEVSKLERLTSVRVSGIKTGYWSDHKKEELVQRLGEYEDLGYSPEELKAMLRVMLRDREAES